MVDVTLAALERFKILLASDPGKVVRFSVSSGGCNGFVKQISTGIVESDDILQTFDGVTLAVDPATATIAGDATIDWVQSLDGSYFEIRIPSATSGCGCGDSFGF
jgi:iron-sulfur cluster insertion protein